MNSIPMLRHMHFPSGHTAIATVTLGVLAVLVSHSMGRWGRSLVFAICGIARRGDCLFATLSRCPLALRRTWRFSFRCDRYGGLRCRAGSDPAAANRARMGWLPLHWLRSLQRGSFILVRASPTRLNSMRLATSSRVRHWRNGRHRVGPSSLVAGLILPASPRNISSSSGLAVPRHWPRVLDQAGWRLHPKWHWKDSLPYLEPNAALDELPPRPLLHEGLRSLLTWTQPISGSNTERLVVRLWRSDYEVVDR